MNIVDLIEKLREIERAVGKVESNTLRSMVIEAEDCALRVERESAEQMRRDSRHLNPIR